MELVSPDNQTSPFSRSNNPRADKPLILPIFGDLKFDVTFAKKFQGLHVFFGDPKFRRDISQKFHGHPLRP
ncbi:hypothetical protein H5410_012942 [Solanum commersonii]|uniref:Uncharacterized protein n=1 Tax=Solanum commersonii TaxID=4109 RepID=A0A9J6ATK0_SOLCO|nr:hypothetical protein H5410_012942 [Solanum commersonii]